jgi:hypothetical protein
MNCDVLDNVALQHDTPRGQPSSGLRPRTSSGWGLAGGGARRYGLCEGNDGCAPARGRIILGLAALYT